MRGVAGGRFFAKPGTETQCVAKLRVHYKSLSIRRRLFVVLLPTFEFVRFALLTCYFTLQRRFSNPEIKRGVELSDQLVNSYGSSPQSGGVFPVSLSTSVCLPQLSHLYCTIRILIIKSACLMRPPSLCSAFMQTTCPSPASICAAMCVLALPRTTGRRRQEALLLGSIR